MDKLTIYLSRPTCEVLHMITSHYTVGMFNYILNYSVTGGGMHRYSEEACNHIEEAVSDFNDAIDDYVIKGPITPYAPFTMDVDKWDRVCVFLMSLNVHHVALLTSVAIKEEVPLDVAMEYLNIVMVANNIIYGARMEGK